MFVIGRIPPALFSDFKGWEEVQGRSIKAKQNSKRDMD